MHRADADAAILTALCSQNDAARRAAAAALAAAGDPGAHPALQRAAATDPDPEVRRICALALPR
jgi:HEAT repeat protein